MTSGTIATGITTSAVSSGGSSESTRRCPARRGTEFAAFVPDGRPCPLRADAAGTLRGRFHRDDEVTPQRILPRPRGQLSRARGAGLRRSLTRRSTPLPPQWLIRDGTGKEQAGRLPRSSSPITSATTPIRSTPFGFSSTGREIGNGTARGTSAEARDDSQRFTEENLRKAHAAQYHKPLVDIISMVKHAADDAARCSRPKSGLTGRSRR